MNHELPNKNYDALVISDYDKGFITTEKIFDLTKQFDKPIFIDSKKTILPTENCFLKINDNEYKKLKNPSDNVIVTKGDIGAEYKGKLYPSQKVNIFDVVGAGDTFLAALVVFYLKHAKIEDAIPFANKAAAIAVQHTGTYVLNLDDINEICN
jgi:D-beta-D-heptose 7-phosphate kinase/D-beta-D-heptose 1-phosphate adenosyltransferase